MLQSNMVPHTPDDSREPFFNQSFAGTKHPDARFRDHDNFQFGQRTMRGERTVRVQEQLTQSSVERSNSKKIADLTAKIHALKMK